LKINNPGEEEFIKGTLYIVSTPIGNLEDITLRALRTLKEVDLIAAEDTRHTRKLLSHYRIHTPLLSYFTHNKIRRERQFLKQLEEGQSVALVSEAGTPGISDPGYSLVRAVLEAGMDIVSIPGPTALISALSLSGLPTHEFIFVGFLSSKSGRRKKELQNLKAETRTIVFYESPHRLVAALRDILEILGDRHAVIARELTKKYEEICRGKVSRQLTKFTAARPRGEFVIVVEGEQTS